MGSPSRSADPGPWPLLTRAVVLAGLLGLPGGGVLPVAMATAAPAEGNPPPAGCLLKSITAVNSSGSEVGLGLKPKFHSQVMSYELPFAQSAKLEVFNLKALPSSGTAKVNMTKDGTAMGTYPPGGQFILLQPGVAQVWGLIVTNCGGGRAAYTVNISQPAPPPPPPPRYSCNFQGVCNRTAGGNYTTNTCEAQCRAPPPPPPGQQTYRCLPVGPNQTRTCLLSACEPRSSQCYANRSCAGNCVAPPVPPPPPGPTPEWCHRPAPKYAPVNGTITVKDSATNGVHEWQPHPSPGMASLTVAHFMVGQSRCTSPSTPRFSQCREPFYTVKQQQACAAVVQNWKKTHPCLEYAKLVQSRSLGVRVRVNGVSLGVVGYGETLTPRQRFPSGTLPCQVSIGYWGVGSTRVTGDAGNVMVDTGIVLEADRSYTLVLTGFHGIDAGEHSTWSDVQRKYAKFPDVHAVLLEDIDKPPRQGHGRLRIVHASPSLGTVQPVVDGSPTASIAWLCLPPSNGNPPPYPFPPPPPMFTPPPGLHGTASCDATVEGSMCPDGKTTCSSLNASCICLQCNCKTSAKMQCDPHEPKPTCPSPPCR
jgi:hypothetical protein